MSRARLYADNAERTRWWRLRHAMRLFDALCNPPASEYLCDSWWHTVWRALDAAREARAPLPPEWTDYLDLINSDYFLWMLESEVGCTPIRANPVLQVWYVWRSITGKITGESHRQDL